MGNVVLSDLAEQIERERQAAIGAAELRSNVPPSAGRLGQALPGGAPEKTHEPVKQTTSCSNEPNHN
jgi:hypothetical protein